MRALALESPLRSTRLPGPPRPARYPRPAGRSRPNRASPRKRGTAPRTTSHTTSCRASHARAAGLPAPPWHGAVVGTPVGREPVDAELREIPAADQLLVEPGLHPAPDRVEAVLMAGHEHSAGGFGRGRQRGGFGTRHRDRLLAQHVIALRQCPE